MNQRNINLTGNDHVGPWPPKKKTPLRDKVKAEYRERVYEKTTEELKQIWWFTLGRILLHEQWDAPLTVIEHEVATEILEERNALEKF